MMLASRRLMELVRESRYGVDPGTPGIFPAFLEGDTWARRERSLLSRAPSRAGVGQQRLRATTTEGTLEPIRTYLYDTGSAVLAWTELLEAAGCRRVDADTWEAASGPHPSLTLRDYRDGMRRVLTGCVASTSLRAEAGEPIAIEATLSGRSGLDNASTFPAGGQALPEPVHFCDAGFTIHVDGWAPIVPEPDQFALSTGTVVAARLRSRATDGLAYRVIDVAPTLRCTLEAERGLDWEAARGRRVAIEWGLGTADRWHFELPRVELAEDPETVRLGSGGEGVALVWRSRDGHGTPLRVRRQH